jgi:hypothetical protein
MTNDVPVLPAKETQKELSKLVRSLRRQAETIAILLVVVAALTYAVIAQHTAAGATVKAQAACQLYKSVAESPVSPTTTELGFRLLAGGRIAYITAGCHLGNLKPADPRVVPFLPKGMH